LTRLYAELNVTEPPTRAALLEERTSPDGGWNAVERRKCVAAKRGETKVRKNLRWWALVTSAVVALSTAALPSTRSDAVDPGGAFVVGPPWSIVAMSSWEVVWHNSSSNETQKWYFRNNGVFQRQEVADELGHTIFVGAPWSIVGLGQFDRQEDYDLLWHSSETNETQIWYLGSDGEKTSIRSRHWVAAENGEPIYIGLPWSIEAVGDLDHDGTADIVWHNATTAQTQVWFMNSAISYQIRQRADVVDENGQAILIALPWSIVGSSDMDGDGRADIVWHNSVSNETQIWYMNGNQIARRATVVDEAGNPIFIGAPWSVAGASDIDTNGKGDIVWYNSQTGETQIWFMNSNQIVSRADAVDAEPTPTPTPTPSPSPSSAPPFTRTLALQEQQVVSGFIPYAGQYPPFGNVPPFHLMQVHFPQSGFADQQLLFVKPGHSTAECGNSAAVVPLVEGQSLTPDQISALYGQTQPHFTTLRPLAAVACLAGAAPIPAFINLDITIQND
jgi:hypothetical protein